MQVARWRAPAIASRKRQTLATRRGVNSSLRRREGPARIIGGAGALCRFRRALTPAISPYRFSVRSLNAQTALSGLGWGGIFKGNARLIPLPLGGGYRRALDI